MKVFEQLNKLLTTAHPKLKLGDITLRNTKYTERQEIYKKPIFVIRKISKELRSQETAGEPPMIEQIGNEKIVQEAPGDDSIEQIKKDMNNKESDNEGLILERMKPVSVKKEALDPQTSQKRLKKLSNIPQKYVQTKLKAELFHSLPVKRNRESSCPCCNVSFPDEISDEELTAHVNNCIDTSEGQKDSKDSDKHSDSSEELKRITEQLSTKCEYCGLLIGRRSKTFQKRHIKECSDEANDRYHPERVIYQELGNIPKKTIDSQSKRYMWY